MKQFTELSFRGKLHRLRALAENAILFYDLDQSRLEYHAFATNLLYRVTTASGERFMLRMAQPGWRTLEDLHSEALWLEALERDTKIGVPCILASRSGEFVLPMSAEGVSGTWNASLMRWLPGRLLGDYLTSANLTKMGELFASLHIHGAAWRPPTGFTRRRFEHWLSRGEPNLITGDQGLTIDSLLPAGMRSTIYEVHRRVEQAYAAIDRRDLRVIHCDLWHDNIKLYHGRLCPFDFEDTVWGFRAHDIAMAMLDLLETVGAERYHGLLAAFRSGYATLLEWPAEPLDPFQAGRLLWKVNWVARFRPAQLESLLECYQPVFQYFLETGQIKWME